jgi:hypothetical protein
MPDKVKTSIVIDRELWEEFRSRVAGEKGLKGLSQAVEEAIEDEVGDMLVAEALERILRDEGVEPPMQISPVRPRTTTDAGESVRELRDSAI